MRFEGGVHQIDRAVRLVRWRSSDEKPLSPTSTCASSCASSGIPPKDVETCQRGCTHDSLLNSHLYLICSWLAGSHHRLISGGVRGRLTVPPILTMCRCAAQCVHVASAGEREVEDKEWQWQGCEERRLPGLDRHRQENAPFMTTRAAASRPKRPKREGETPPWQQPLGKSQM